MKKKFFVVAAVIISSQLQAQQDTTILDEAVVTANKFEKKQSQLGKVVAVINKEQLQKSAGKSLAQVLNEQAGITVAGVYNAAGSVQTVFMRGASSGRTLILLDGMPVNDPSMINNEFDLNLISIYDVERIEICKGAQSTLYGSDAIAGVINIITTKKEVNKSFSINAASAFGNLNTAKNNIQLYGKTGDFIYTTRFAKLSTDGFSSANDKTGYGNFDKDGFKGHVINAAFQYQFTPALSAKTFIQSSNYKADVDAGVFTDDKDFTINNSGINSGFGLFFKRNMVTITGNYQYGKIKRYYLNDSFHVSGFAKFESNNYNGSTHFAEIYGNVDVGDWMTILAGSDYRRSSMDQQYLSISSFGPYSSEFDDTSMHQTSFYASVLLNPLNKKLNVEIGGRINDHSRYGNNATYTFNPSYSVSGNLRLFGSIATGFKSPSIYQLFDEFSGNPELKAEKAVNYEIGFQQSNKKISSRLVYFHRNIKNGIDYNYVSYQYFNFIKQKVNGVELELQTNPVKGLIIKANYTYLSGEEKTQSRKNFADTTYNYLLRRPKHNLNISLSYQFTSSLFLSINGKSVSKRFDVGGFMQEDVSLKSYFILSTYGEYKAGEHLKLFADFQNLTNKKFFDIRGYNSIPFLITGGVIFNW